MRILFLANRIPYPPYRGDKLKVYNLAKKLRHQHELHLLTFYQNKKDIEYKAELEKIFTSVKLIYLPKWQSIINALLAVFSSVPFQVAYFRSRAMHKALASHLQLNHYVAIHNQHIRMAQYTLPLLPLPAILDMPDAFSLYWERRMKNQKSSLKKWFERIEQKRVSLYEKNLKKYPLSLVCSIEDKEHLEKIHKATNIKLLRNGVNLETFRNKGHDYTQNNKILFTGNMDYAPNIDGVQYFVEEILPIILEKHPQTEFHIVGQRPVKEILKLASKSVVIHGFVENLADAYRMSSFLVAPLRIGAGTQNKVLEALAMGLPVVCTDIGFKGLEMENEVGILHAPNKESFAEACLRFIESETLRRTIGEKGYAIAKDKFAWEGIANQLENYFYEVAQK